MFLVLLKIKFGEEYQVIRKFQDSLSKKIFSLTMWWKNKLNDSGLIYMLDVKIKLRNSKKQIGREMASSSALKRKT